MLIRALAALLHGQSIQKGRLSARQGVAAIHNIRIPALIAMIVPAHNEEDCITACVRSLVAAATHPDLGGELARVFVVLDSCSDATGARAHEQGALTVECTARNVGIARQIGARAALDMSARWLAFTDADTQVAPDWLVAQLALNADAVCGTIGVDPWGAYGERMRRHFSLTYNDQDWHSHTHGANLGVSAKAFSSVGGFQPLASGEDVAPVQTLAAASARIARSRAPRVLTSARPSYKATGGFGATLERIEAMRQWAGAPIGAAP